MARCLRTSLSSVIPCGHPGSRLARVLPIVNARIMIVDDSPTLRRMLRRELETAGYEVVEASGGPAALDLLRSTPVQMVISDVNMNPMDGLSLVAEIRKSHSRAQLPVLMLTTEAGDDLKMKGKQAGANGWLVKPLVPARLHAALDHLLKRSASP